MSKELQRRDVDLPAVQESGTADQAAVIAAWLRARKETTRKCYLEWIHNFASWFTERGYRRPGSSTDADAVLDLAAFGTARANLVVQEWIDSQIANDTARATYAKKYAAVRSFMRALQRADMVGFVVDIDLPSSEPPSAITLAKKYKLVRLAYAKLISHLEPLAQKEDASIEDLRDWAIVRTMRDMGLRRTEVHTLDESDVDFKEGVVRILGKGRRRKQDVHLPSSLTPVLQDWLKSKHTTGFLGGALFCSTRDGERLDIKTYNTIFARRMQEIGMRLTPHDLRRIFATRAIQEFGLNRARALTRHKHASTLEIYDISQGEDLQEMAETAATDEEK